MIANLLEIDKGLFFFIYQLPHPSLLVYLMRFLSTLGSFGFIWMVLGLYFRKFGQIILALLLVFFIVDIGLKNIVARERPYPSSVDSLIGKESFSFPSGHAAAAFSALYILGYARRKKNKKTAEKEIINNKIHDLRKELLISPFLTIVDNLRDSAENQRLKFGLYLLAFLISFSRIYLGKHYPLDMVVGAGIGWVIGYFVYKIQTSNNK